MARWRGMLLGMALALPQSLWAHEFWISPETYRVAPDEPILVHLRVGENFKGSSYAYIPPNFTRFDVVMGDEVMAVDGRAGDRPAMNMAVGQEGLAVIVHQTRAYDLTYNEFEKFVNFTKHKDFTWALDRLEERGLSGQKVRESYTRFGKSLVAVGNGQGADREVGLEIEIVAEANPYTDDLSAGFPVRVLYQGAPRANEQVELFARSGDEVVVSQYRTDAEGRVVLPVEAGVEYLVDSVLLRELEVQAEGDAAWESIWASLTFRVPE